MRKLVSVVLVAAILFVSSPCFADGGPLRKLGRGVANVATGVLEVPRNIVTVTEEDGYVAGATYGIIKGLAMGILRTVVGVYETVTFIIPIPFHFEPILEPEFLMGEEY